MQNAVPLAVPGSLDYQNHALIALATIILLSGAFGGWAAFLTQSRDEAGKTQVERALWLRFLVMGIVAATCVPLFLSLLKSELIAAIFREPTGSTSYDSYLVFAGLCLIAAFSARRFIDSISERLFREVREARRDAAQAGAKATEASEVAHEAISEIVAAGRADLEDALPADHEQSDDEATSADLAIHLSADEQQILQAMAARTYRTASGIAEASGIPRHRVSDILETLADKKLVLPTKSPRTGGARWAISRNGLAALGKLRTARGLS